MTVITFVRVTNFGEKTYADNILAYDTLLFILACFASYIAMRRQNNLRLELIADVAFLLGMSVMVFVGILLLNLG